MSTPINDGGPAFPRTGADGHTSPQSGMTLRDWFAGQALAGTDISRVMEEALYDGATPDEFARVLTGAAYKMADAMIAAREANS